MIDRIAIELCRHGGTMNGRLPVTYDDFERYGIHRHAIGPAVREAVALGFIEVTERGRAGNAEWRKPSLYRLTFCRSDHDVGDGTHEWMKVGEEQAEGVAAAARKAKAPNPAKTKSQWRKPPILSGDNRHSKSESLSAETTTTCVSAETTTTIYISGREDAA
ncbi:hypothetical protein [Bradyrhizobium sp. JYMT SZCCT0180]|uniref:hypothetical protein n=1 Tax=Bradyrhizobium sp. JYMT SZCCT0180 TaxID=2807666 RepID=UPI001BA74318|nr:hypothetical protein [Bradyrhizobium sp. JYMT SZCCT0180]MBR1212057.1 hypothetical protein [Bradyrhizobium sp. JYMT SZCCT0180]